MNQPYWNDWWSSGLFVGQVFDQCRFIRCDSKNGRWFLAVLYLRLIFRWFPATAMLSSWFIRREHRRECQVHLPFSFFFLFGCSVIVKSRSQGVVVEWYRFCETTCEFAMMQLPPVIPAWSHRAITCTCLRIYLDFFCNALWERMTNAHLIITKNFRAFISLSIN